MDIHNTAEDLIIEEINEICDSLEAKKKQEGICTCNQCRLDAVCYVLNRTEPHYVVSHRGASRIDIDANLQKRADITALAYEGIKRVSHNQRPYVDHNKTEKELSPDVPFFNIPTIMGRVFNGLNFSPMANISVELLQNGKLAEMKNDNWQNPYTLIPNTNGTFTFLPKSVTAEKIDTHGIFEFTVRIAASGFADLNHIIKIPALSVGAGSSSSLARTYKLPDLYLFPPGDEKDQLIINE